MMVNIKKEKGLSSLTIVRDDNATTTTASPVLVDDLSLTPEELMVFAKGFFAVMTPVYRRSPFFYINIDAGR